MDLETALNYFNRPEFDFPEEEMQCILEHPEEVTPLFVQDWRKIMAMDAEEIRHYDEVRYLHGIEFLLYWKNEEIKDILREMMSQKDIEFVEALLGDQWFRKVLTWVLRLEDKEFFDFCSSVATDEDRPEEWRRLALEIMGNMTLLDLVSQDEWTQRMRFFCTGGINPRSLNSIWYSLAKANIVSRVETTEHYMNQIVDQLSADNEALEGLKRMETTLSSAPRDFNQYICRQTGGIGINPVDLIRDWPIYNSDEFFKKNSNQQKSPINKKSKLKNKNKKKAGKNKRWI